MGPRVSFVEVTDLAGTLNMGHWPIRRARFDRSAPCCRGRDQLMILCPATTPLTKMPVVS